MEVMAKS